ncbi:hypothetical protein GCM10012279_56410 [Micromonospora yangpuensis]|nr:hypothetical protein GCM10012279_56410 [Micromonospora yangpuensis]
MTWYGNSAISTGPNPGPGDLRVRPLPVEPVVRLPRQHRVRRRVGQRHRLGAAGQRGDAGGGGGQLRPHARVGFHRQHLVAEIEDHPGEQAGPRAEIHHPGRGGQAVQRPAYGRRRVGRAEPVVRLGGGAEGEPVSGIGHAGQVNP